MSLDYIKKRRREYSRKQYSEKPWTVTYRCIRSRCIYEKDNLYFLKGIKCHITPNELRYLWFRDKAFLMDRPTIDRIDNNGDYTLDNCRYIEFIENLRGRKKREWQKYGVKRL